MQACADVEAVIGRARSLFGDVSAAETPSGATDIDRAAQTAVAARARTVGLSGHGIDAYQSVVDRSVGLLDTAAGSDRALATHMKTAAAVTQAGAARLDHIAAQNQMVSRAAAGAKTPADERVILAALRSQLAQTSQVVQSTQQQATALAGHIRALQYPKDTPQPGAHGVQAQMTGWDHGGAPPLSPGSEPSPAPQPGGSTPPVPAGGGHPLQGLPAPLEDFTKYQLHGQPIPNPPAPNVTADELRLALMQQNIDFDKFVAWFNQVHGGNMSQAELFESMGAFDSSATAFIASLPALPEGGPVTVAAAIGVLISGFKLATADLGDGQIPVPPPP